jgi:hypothetical protein
VGAIPGMDEAISGIVPIKFNENEDDQFNGLQKKNIRGMTFS